jgi:multiple sugar transport system substrate-binding protein
MKSARIMALAAVLLLAAATVFAGGAQESKGPVTLSFMVQPADLTPEWVDKFNAENPDINLVRVESNWEKWMADAMAGMAPDLAQMDYGSDVPYFARRGLLLDMTDRLKKSKLIRFDDIDLLGNAHYQFDGTDFGKGKWYGLSKDYSNIGCITYNVEMFKKAGLAKLSPTEPIAYQDDLFNLAKKLTVKDAAGHVITWGYEFQPDWVEFYTSDMAYAEGLFFFTDSTRSKMNNDPKMRNLWKYWTRFPIADVSSNIRNPTAGWAGAAFQSDRVAMVQLGYWFGAQLMENPGYAEKYSWAPTPILRKGAKRYANTLGATGTVIYAKTKHPDQAFRVFEWYTGGDYAIARTKTGWGIPPLVSFRKYLPVSDPWNKLRADIAFDDAKYFVPWMASTLVKSVTLFGAAWSNNIDDLVLGKVNEDTFIDRFFAELDKELAVGKSELGM